MTPPPSAVDTWAQKMNHTQGAVVRRSLQQPSQSSRKSPTIISYDLPSSVRCPPERRRERTMTEPWKAAATNSLGGQGVFLLLAGHPPGSPLVTLFPWKMIPSPGWAVWYSSGVGEPLPLWLALDSDLFFLSRRACWTSRLNTIFSSSVMASYSSSSIFWRRSFSFSIASLRLVSVEGTEMESEGKWLTSLGCRALSGSACSPHWVWRVCARERWLWCRGGIPDLWWAFFHSHSSKTALHLC